MTGTGCIGGHISNYHTITTRKAPSNEQYMYMYMQEIINLHNKVKTLDILNFHYSCPRAGPNSPSVYYYSLYIRLYTSSSKDSIDA